MIADAIAFFQAFDGMEDGLPSTGPPGRRRLLDAPPTRPTSSSPSPVGDTVDEAPLFAASWPRAARSAGRGDRQPRAPPSSTPAAAGAGRARRARRTVGRAAAARAAGQPGRAARRVGRPGDRGARLRSPAERRPRRRSPPCRCWPTTCTTSTGWPAIAGRSSRSGRHVPGRLSSPAVPHVLIAADADWVVDEVRAALEGPDVTVHRVPAPARPSSRRPTRQAPDLAVLDLQIGNMGGMAICMDLRLDESAGRLPAHQGADAARPGRRPLPGPPGRRRRLADQAARSTPAAACRQGHPGWRARLRRSVARRCPPDTSPASTPGSSAAWLARATFGTWRPGVQISPPRPPARRAVPRGSSRAARRDRSTASTGFRARPGARRR